MKRKEIIETLQDCGVNVIHCGRFDVFSVGKANFILDKETLRFSCAEKIFNVDVGRISYIHVDGEEMEIRA